jgi:glycine/D-amino acid oxidase-like deaminating enzyme
VRRSKDAGATWQEAVSIYERDGDPAKAKLKFPQIAAANGVAYVLWEEWGDARDVVKNLADLEKKRGPVDLYVRRVKFRD